MNIENTAFLLTSIDGAAPAPILCGVHAQGVLDGVLFELTVRQTYRNTSERNLEVVYTFPLPSQAVLLGFASELNGSRMEGLVVRRHQAEQQYEQALSEGDAPVMLEALGDGLHTANVGNLEPDDELVIELRFAQLLSFEQGRLRLSIPTTIAPRYGDPAAAGLQPQHVPTASLSVAYPLNLSVLVGKGLGDAPIECATHRMGMEPCAEGRRYRLEPGAWLDRDVVLSVQLEGEAPSFLSTSQDPVDPKAGFVVMAAFQPRIEAPRAALALKLLVDCSGSMAGDSLASAKSALHGVMNQLGDADKLSITRFGSSVEHLLLPSRAVVEVKHRVQLVINDMEADLGGTEMESALRAVFDLQATVQQGAKDVLLLTDGEIWEADAIIARAKSSQHRIFVIGLGASPAEGVLRRLAEETGGAAEFVTPGEAFEAAARRMLARMRQPRHSEAVVEWGATPVWQTRLPASVYGGDTVVAFAGFKTPRALAPRLLAMNGQGQSIVLSTVDVSAESSGTTLPRMAAARRMQQCGEREALALALSHQLLSSQTHCILVHVRDAEGKATDEAQLHPVTSMLAAGWGATATVGAAPALDAMAAPTVWRSSRASVLSMDIHFSLAEPDEDICSVVPAFLRTRDDEVRFETLRELAEAIHAYLRNTNKGGSSLDAYCWGLSIHDDLRRALEEVGALFSERDLPWLLLARWINSRSGGLGDAALSNALTAPMSRADKRIVDTAMRMFDQSLGLYGLDDWKSSRLSRIARSLRQVAV